MNPASLPDQGGSSVWFSADGPVGRRGAAARAGQRLRAEAYGDQSNDEGHIRSSQSVAGTDAAVGGRHDHCADSDADQPGGEGDTGAERPRAGPEAAGGTGQGKPADDHAGKPDQGGGDGSEAPGAQCGSMPAP